MKTPKVVKGEKIIKVLVKNGYWVKSRKGSHVSLSNRKVHHCCFTSDNDRNI